MFWYAEKIEDDGEADLNDELAAVEDHDEDVQEKFAILLTEAGDVSEVEQVSSVIYTTI